MGLLKPLLQLTTEHAVNPGESDANNDMFLQAYEGLYGGELRAIAIGRERIRS
jgi:hypothetical protein